MNGRLHELFAAALELDAAERARFVEAQTAGDDALRAELLSLLEHASDERFLERPAVLEALGLDALAPEAGTLPTHLGPYELLEVLGEGGMGVVHLAREQGLGRLVALKVLRTGLATPSALARFEREGRALAKLHHPGVAQVHAAGTLRTERGAQPYFAMERVEGLPIGEHADRNALGLAERLRLLAEVADAIDHAHARGVVHRDLKPSNVLVDTSAGRAQPKVLDFGVARLLDEEAEGGRTLAGQIVGTLAYMSPEQAAGESAAIGPASDVYGLGALGYELVTGQPPLDLRGLTLLEAARRVREQEPLPAGRIRSEARGDVETILSKALAKDPARRYASAAALARDLRRFLAHEPIHARAPSAWYLARTFARRRRGLVAAVASVAFVLLGGALVSARLALEAATERDAKALLAEEASRERDRARSERLAALESLRLAEEARAHEAQQRAAAQRATERAHAVVNLVRRMLEDVHPDREGRDVLVRDVLDRTAREVERELGEHPELGLEMRSLLGVAYEALGLLDQAEEQYRVCAALTPVTYGELDPRTQVARAALASLELARDRLASAQPQLENALARHLLLRGEEHPDSLKLLSAYGRLLRRLGHHEQERALLTRLLETRERVLGVAHRETITTRHSLGSLLWIQGELEPARAVLERTFELQLAELGDDHPGTAQTIGALATILRDLGRTDEAESAYRRALDLHLAGRGEDHPSTWTAMNNLAAQLSARGQREEAEGLLRRVVERREAVLGDEHSDTLVALNNLALLLSESERLGESRAIQERILAIKRRTLGEDHRSTLTSLFNLGLLDLRAGDPERAERLFAETLERAARAYPAGHWSLGHYTEGHAAALVALERHAQAEEALERCYALYVAALGADHARSQGAARRLAALLERTSRASEAAHWRSRAGE